MDKAPLPKSTVALENEINSMIHQDFKSAILHKNTMDNKNDTHDVIPEPFKLIFPTIEYLDNDSDPSIESDLLVISDIFESEPEDKSNFTMVIREISKYKKIKNKKYIQKQDKRTHDAAFSAKYNSESINNIKINKVMKVTNERETVKQIALDEDQEELYDHKEEESCLKESIGKIIDLIEEVWLDLATDNKCTQDINLQ